MIATHPRLLRAYEDSTLIEHMPKEHQYQYEKWNPGRILNWANTVGSNTELLMQEIMKVRSHPVRGYKSCMAILSFAKTYGNEALELTCEKALSINTKSVSSIESILKRKIYLANEEIQPVNNDLFNNHENIREDNTYQ